MQKKADALLFQKSRKYQKALLESSRDIAIIKDEKELIKKSCDLICKNLSPEFGGIYLLEEETYVLKEQKNPQISLPEVFDFSSREKEQLKNHNGVIFNYYAGDTKVDIILPIGSGEEIIGFLFLGDKQDKEMYSIEDIEIFLDSFK